MRIGGGAVEEGGGKIQIACALSGSLSLDCLYEPSSNEFRVARLRLGMVSMGGFVRLLLCALFR